jgi:hypothetical protein
LPYTKNGSENELDDSSMKPVLSNSEKKEKEDEDEDPK